MDRFKNWTKILNVSRTLSESAESEEEKAAAKRISFLALREIEKSLGIVRKEQTEETKAEPERKNVRNVRETYAQKEKPASNKIKLEPRASRPMTAEPEKAPAEKASEVQEEAGMDETVPIQKEPVKEDALEDLSQTMPVVEENVEQVDYLPYDEFAFVYHYTKYPDESGREKHAEIIAFPISSENGSKRFIAWSGLIAGGDTEHTTRICDDVRGSVVVKIDDVDYIVSGRIQDGEFVSGVRLTDREVRDGVQREFKHVKHGDSKHIVIVDDGIRIDVVPFTPKNQKNGYAAYIYCIQIDGRPIYHGDSLEKERIEFEWNGEKYALRCRMRDEVCYSRIDRI